MFLVLAAHGPSLSPQGTPVHEGAHVRASTSLFASVTYCYRRRTALPACKQQREL